MLQVDSPESESPQEPIQGIGRGPCFGSLLGGINLLSDVDDFRGGSFSTS